MAFDETIINSLNSNLVTLNTNVVDLASAVIGYTEALKENKKSVDDNTKEQSKLGKTLTSVAHTAIDTLSKKIDAGIKAYKEAQSKSSYALVGANESFADLTRNLRSMYGGRTDVSMSDLFSSMNELIKSGLSQNVQQIAYYETLAKQVDARTDRITGAIAQLMRLGNDSAYENRLALEYSLRDILNANYQNSMYIKEMFKDVAEKLVGVNILSGQGVENSIQTWLGSYYSSGVSSSTISSMAEALNKLGTGDISLMSGSGIGNLIAMGASLSGLDLGAIYNGGLNAANTNRLLGGISSYLRTMGANDSNVVRSQLSQQFGVNITDLLAMANFVQPTTTANNDIDRLVNDYQGFVHFGTRFNNLLSNALFGQGMEIANDPISYASYKTVDFASGMAGDIFGKAWINPLAKLLTAFVGDAAGGNGISAFADLFNGFGSMIGSLTNGTSSSGSTVIMSDASTGDLAKSFKSSKTIAQQAIGIQGDEPDAEEILRNNVADIRNLMNDYFKEMHDDLRSISDKMMGGTSW